MRVTPRSSLVAHGLCPARRFYRRVVRWGTAVRLIAGGVGLIAGGVGLIAGGVGLIAGGEGAREAVAVLRHADHGRHDGPQLGHPAHRVHRLALALAARGTPGGIPGGGIPGGGIPGGGIPGGGCAGAVRPALAQHELRGHAHTERDSQRRKTKKKTKKARAELTA